MIAAEKTYQEYKKLFGEAIDLDKFNHYSVVHHSNSIEGSSLTLAETILLLDENLTPKNKPFEHSQMTVDHYRALKYVLALANERQPLTTKIIQQIAALVKKHTGSIHRTMSGDIDESKGDWRTVTVVAGESMFKATNIPERVAQLVEEINENIQIGTGFKEVNTLAFDAHFQLVSIYPFSDGNGRASRLLMNYVQQYHGFPLSYIHSEDKSEYYQALVDTRKGEDISIFHEFMFAQLNKMMTEEIGKLNKSRKFKPNKNGGLSLLF